MPGASNRGAQGPDRMSSSEQVPLDRAYEDHPKTSGNKSRSRRFSWQASNPPDGCPGRPRSTVPTTAGPFRHGLRPPCSRLFGCGRRRGVAAGDLTRGSGFARAPTGGASRTGAGRAGAPSSSSTCGCASPLARRSTRPLGPLPRRPLSSAGLRVAAPEASPLWASPPRAEAQYGIRNRSPSSAAPPRQPSWGKRRLLGDGSAQRLDLTRLQLPKIARAHPLQPDARIIHPDEACDGVAHRGAEALDEMVAPFGEHQSDPAVLGGATQEGRLLGHRPPILEAHPGP